MIDLQKDAYAAVKAEIDKVIQGGASPSELEMAKGEILASNDAYVQFVQSVLSCSPDDVTATLRELSKDKEFFDMIGAGLTEISEAAKRIDTGELRVHSYTVYTVTRLAAPRLMVETGVANGKSSSFILRAMQRTGHGNLISVDLPDVEGKPGLPDNSGVTIESRPTGWLVPDALRTNWDLQLGDARDILPAVKKTHPEIDVFFHDSLHTYDHMGFELDHALGWVKPGGVILCDDITAHAAFSERAEGRTAAAFGSFGLIGV